MILNNTVPTEQKTPTISVSSSGLITATAGDKTATQQLTTQGAQTITPGTSAKTIASQRYLTGTQTIAGDANLTSANIKSGVSIFGVNGGLQQWVRFIPPASSTSNTLFTVNNVPEKPSVCILYCTSFGSLTATSYPAVYSIIAVDGYDEIYSKSAYADDYAHRNPRKGQSYGINSSIFSYSGTTFTIDLTKYSTSLYFSKGMYVPILCW